MRICAAPDPAGAAAGAVGREAAHAREPSHFGGRHRTDHRVAVLAPRAQRGQHRHEMLLHEQHRRDHQVAGADVGHAARERGAILAPFGGSVHAQAQAGKFVPQPLLGPRRRAGDVAVQRHQHDVQRHGGGRRVRRRSAPWHRRGSRR
jgi:hypothetical protein